MPVPSKNTGIYTMFNILQEFFFSHAKGSVLGLLLGFVEGTEGGGSWNEQQSPK